MAIVRTTIVVGVSLLLIAAQRSSPAEQKVVGAWSWTYIEGVGRIIFTSDHKVTIGFPPNQKDGRKIADEEFDIVQSGIWRLDGETLVTEIDNAPLIRIVERLDPSNTPSLEKKVERRRIARLENNEMVFEDGSSFKRIDPNVHPAKLPNRDQISDASNRIPVRTLALVGGATEARLGSSIDDFRSAWGTPSNEEALTRTARLLWRWSDEGNGPRPKGVSEAEVSFLDGIACEVVLRSKQQLKKTDVINLARALVVSFQTSDLGTLKFGRDGSRTYAIKDGGYIVAWLKEKPAVMLIRDRLFIQNAELFGQEAARVRPPTSNH